MIVKFQPLCRMIRELQPMTAWVASEAARSGRCPAGDMVLLFAAVETAVKRIAFTVRQVSRGASVSLHTRRCCLCHQSGSAMHAIQALSCPQAAI